MTRQKGKWHYRSQLWHLFNLCRIKWMQCNYCSRGKWCSIYVIDKSQARIHRGGGELGCAPPTEIRQVVGSCIDAWWVGEGVQQLFFLIIIIFFWLASLAHIIKIYYMYTYFIVECSAWNGHTFSIFPISKLWKKINFPSLAFMKGHFHIFLAYDYTILHHLSEKNSGRTNRLPRHIYSIKKYHVICVFL